MTDGLNYVGKKVNWGKNRQIKSDEYEELYKRLVKVEGKTDELTSFVQQVQTNISSVRGLINRKLGEVVDRDNMAPESDLNVKPDGLDELRRLAKL